MSEAIFERKVLSRLDRVERTMQRILDRMDGERDDGSVAVTKLTARERKLVAQALRDAKEGKLLSKEQVFG